ncbi:MAG: nuclear transport factor 2 family protein [Burkholderiales bacterium]|nr:nuclear transport factor 2 family protein [Burkholderiales bacterium]
MIRARDTAGLPALLAPDAVFRSPVAHKPYAGAAAVAMILQTAERVFSNFTYHRSLVSEDGQSVVLEFSADVGDKALKGIDMIRFGADGKIIEFEVMVRPATGLAALGEAMAKGLAGRV